jgi:adenylate cyclase
MAHDALSVANFQKGLFQEAREAAARAVECNPGFSVPHLLLAAALVRLGRGAEAKAAAQCAMSLNPAFTISGYSMTVGHVPDVFAPYRCAWAEAGLPA